MTAVEQAAREVELALLLQWDRATVEWRAWLYGVPLIRVWSPLGLSPRRRRWRVSTCYAGVTKCAPGRWLDVEDAKRAAIKAVIQRSAS